MNTNTMNAVIANDISSRAIKVKLTRGSAVTRVRDRLAEAAVNAQFGDDYLVTKKLFRNPGNPIAARAKLANEMYAYLQKYTLPYNDDGWRLLPNNLYFDVSKKLAEYKDAIDRLNETIVRDYDAIVQADLSYRGTGTVDEYPSLDRMRRMLYVTYYFEPIATEGDFRFEVTEQDRQRLAELLADTERQAKADLLEQIKQPLRAFIKKMSVPIGEPGSIFRNSLVENLHELVHRLPQLNLDGDQTIQAAIDALDEFVKPYVANADVLREDQMLREAAKAKADALMQRFDGYSF